MREFTDAKGDQWRLELTLGDRDRVKRLHGVDLVELFADDLTLMAKLSTDFGKLVAVVAELCNDQIDARGLSADDFAGRFGGDVLSDAFDALTQAVIDFFPSEARREKMRQYLERIQRLERKMMETATPALLAKLDEQIDQITPEEWVQSLTSAATPGRAS